MQKLTWVLQNSFERFKDYYTMRDSLSLHEVIEAAIEQAEGDVPVAFIVKKTGKYIRIIKDALNISNNFTDLEIQLRKDMDIHFIRELLLNLYGYYLENGY